MGSWPIRAYFFVLVALFVAAAASAFAYVERQTNQDARREAEADSRFAAQGGAKQLSEYIRLVQTTTGQLAANPQISAVSSNPAGCSLAFTGFAGQDRSHLDVIGPDGAIACSSRTRPAVPSFRYGRAWVANAIRRPTLVASTLDGATGTRMAIISSPIPGAKGIVAGFVDLPAVGPSLASLFSGGHALEFLITSNDGRTAIARSINPGRWAGASLTGIPFAQAGTGVERKDLDGRPRLYAESPVAGTGWKVYVGADKAAALHAANRLKDRQLIIFLLGLAAILLAAWLAYRNLIEPIRRLSQALRSTTGKEAPTPVPVAGPAEVHALGTDVNALISSVKIELLERQRAEARARAVMEAALDAVITIDGEGRILEFNPAAEATFGHRRADVLGAQMAELLIPPSLRSAHHRGLEKYLATGEGPVIGRRVELSALRADGSEFPIELAISRVSLEGPPVFTGYVRDISERKEAEGQLHKLAAIVESSRDAIVGRTVEGIVTSWNAAAERLFGYPADEIVGRPISDLAPPERSNELGTINERLGRGEIIERFETVRVRKDGTRIEVESTISPVTDESGRVVGASAISRDVTERKHVEGALRESEARYRDLFENATDLIAVADLESRLTAVNEAFVRTLGYTREELIGRPLRDLVPPEWHERIQQADDGKIGRQLDSTVYEHELIAKDGGRIQIEVASRLIEESGRPVGTEAICRNISERKQLEEQLRQSQRLESIGRLAGGIAHDFNNLLTVISGYSEALLEAANGDSEPELKEIAAAAERAAILTRQLLAFSRRQVLQPRIVSLNEVVEGIMPMLGRLIGEDIDLVASLDPALDTVSADPNQIEQVILNLVINARDAMPEGGKLTIETSNADLDEDYVADRPEARLGTHASLAVSDNGVGMDADTLARVYEPFFTTKPTGSGTGLGLSTVYGIVKQSGGNVWVYSEPGKGTTFKVYLPARNERLEVKQPEVPQPATPTGTETILIVEDEEKLRVLATRILRKSGYKVLATGSTTEALRLTGHGAEGIDLLLTDLVMPEMSGRELAEQVNKQVLDVRVLFMSGYADDAVTRNGALQPGAAYLEKPFSGRELARKVREVLDATAPEGQAHYRHRGFAKQI
jgi:two-component system cell cycle sensor histidine kinase/response regulator CckA